MPNGGNILGRTFSLFAASWLPFLSISFLIHSPLIAFDVLFFLIGFISDKLSSLDSWLSTLLPLFVTPLVTAAVVYGVFRSLRGQPVNTMGCVRAGLSRWQAIVGLSLLLTLAVGVGLLLCLIPGIVVACGLFVAVPALLVEELPVTDAMSRSWSLTHGYKLPLFAVFVVLGIIGFGAETLLQRLSPSLMRPFVNHLVNIPMTSLQAIAASVAYHEIRLRREGVDVLEWAAVFD